MWRSPSSRKNEEGAATRVTEIHFLVPSGTRGGRRTACAFDVEQKQEIRWKSSKHLKIPTLTGISPNEVLPCLAMMMITCCFSMLFQSLPSLPSCLSLLLRLYFSSFSFPTFRCFTSFPSSLSVLPSLPFPRLGLDLRLRRRRSAFGLGALLFQPPRSTEAAWRAPLRSLELHPQTGFYLAEGRQWCGVLDSTG